MQKHILIDSSGIKNRQFNDLPRSEEVYAHKVTLLFTEQKTGVPQLLSPAAEKRARSNGIAGPEPATLCSCGLTPVTLVMGYFTLSMEYRSSAPSVTASAFIRIKFHPFHRVRLFSSRHHSCRANHYILLRTSLPLGSSRRSVCQKAFLLLQASRYLRTFFPHHSFP